MALPPKIINEFRGNYSYLSNFYIEPDGTHVEGEYQRAKCMTPRDRHRFDGLTPAQCKAEGKKVELRPDWNDVKVSIMKGLVYQKFLDHPRLAERLLLTGDSPLEESNWWGDTVWGTHYGKGQNLLGIILMEVRNQLIMNHAEELLNGKQGIHTDKSVQTKAETTNRDRRVTGHWQD